MNKRISLLAVGSLILVFCFGTLFHAGQAHAGDETAVATNEGMLITFGTASNSTGYYHAIAFVCDDDGKLCANFISIHRSIWLKYAPFLPGDTIRIQEYANKRYVITNLTNKAKEKDKDKPKDSSGSDSGTIPPGVGPPDKSM